MTSSVTHFEIYAEEPAKLAEFYRTLLGWQVDKAPGIDYWRIDTAPGGTKGIGGGLLFRPIPGPRSWVHYVHVDSLDHTLERILELGGAVVRNRIRRRLREALRVMAPSFQPGWDVLIIARPALVGADHKAFVTALHRVLRRGGVLKGSDG